MIHGRDVIWVAISLMMFGAGLLLKSYLGEKGKNLATKEDVREITKRVEEVKAQINRAVWIEQERIRFKQSVYTRILESLAILQHVYAKYSAALAGILPGHEGNRADLDRVNADFGREVAVARQEFVRAAMVAELVLNSEAVAALERLENAEEAAFDEERFADALDSRRGALHKGARRLSPPQRGISGCRRKGAPRVLEHAGASPSALIGWRTNVSEALGVPVTARRE